MYCRHAHNVRGTLSQFAAWLESGCLRSDGYETFEAETTRPRKPYLDLKRIKTVAPGWRCAAVYCAICNEPNFGGTWT